MNPGAVRLHLSLPLRSTSLGDTELFLYIDTYTITLPDNLPPTYRGRAIRFGYELVVGTCRAGASGGVATNGTGRKRPTGANSISRVMKVPIRVYNHVNGRRCLSFIRGSKN